MEKIYQWINRNKSTCLEIVITYVIATVTNVLSGQEFATVRDFFSEFIKWNFSIGLMWGALVGIIVMYIFYYLMGQWIIKQQTSHKLKNIILQNADAIYNEITDASGYAWGTNRTILCCDNIIQGWKPEQFVVEKLEVAHMLLEPKLQDVYQEFMEEQGKNIERHGNSNNRWMLQNIIPNYNKNEKKIYLQLQETDYCTTSCIWDAWRKDSPAIEKRQRIKDAFLSQSREYLPHSLCLHLVIVTADERVVVTTISRFKKNDYAHTKAVTLGEQIEVTDFQNATGYYNDFIERWVKRALSEEFGIDEEQYKAITGKEAIRVLALDFEGDIYNYSLMVVLNLRIKYDRFKDEVCRNPARDKEYDWMEAMLLKDIPKELKRWREAEKDKEYHPSSYLRMYLTYIHFYGIERFVKEYGFQRKKK